MKMTIFMLMAILTGNSCSAGEDMDGQVQIYYIPIGVETFVPITKENIEASAAKHGQFDLSSGMAGSMQQILDASDVGSFDNQKVRAKIIFPGSKIVYIDNYGGISSSESGVRKLGENDLMKVKELFERELRY